MSGERLRAIPLFRDVDTNALEALAGRFVSRSYQPGQSIYAQGDAGDKFCIVVRGTVSISTLDAGHQAIRLADLQDGDYFGEVEMVNKGRRTTTVKAQTPSLVLALDAEHFHRMVDELGALSWCFSRSWCLSRGRGFCDSRRLSCNRRFGYGSTACRKNEAGERQHRPKFKNVIFHYSLLLI